MGATTDIVATRGPMPGAQYPVMLRFGGVSTVISAGTE